MKYVLSLCLAIGMACGDVVHAEEEPKQQQVNEKVNKLKQYLAERKAKQEAAKQANQ